MGHTKVKSEKHWVLVRAPNVKDFTVLVLCHLCRVNYYLVFVHLGSLHVHDYNVNFLF